MFRPSKAHFISGMQFPLYADALSTPPVSCDLAVGDLVTMVNAAGIEFQNLVITGFAPEVEGGRFVYLDKDSWWFANDPKTLIKQAHRVEEAPVDNSAECYA